MVLETGGSRHFANAPDLALGKLVTALAGLFTARVIRALCPPGTRTGSEEPPEASGAPSRMPRTAYEVAERTGVPMAQGSGPSH